MNNNKPSSELIIRPASYNDIPHIQTIVLKTWPVTYTEIVGKEQVDYMVERLYNTDALKEQIMNRHYFYLALKDYHVIGFASFSHVVANTYKLQKLYVLPAEQKTGAGKALLETVETVAKSM